VKGHARVGFRCGRQLLCAVAVLAHSASTFALPNTHAPAISTWDSRASSIVFGLGRSISPTGSFTLASYNANFSSTSGILSAQFGVHYVTYRDSDDAPEARGASAGGVALFNFPLSERFFPNAVPRTSFAAYLGGVPTALFSGELNFISVPLVLGAGLPISPTPWLGIVPWVELSPGLNFDTSISAVSTASAVAAASDGTLSREEVQALVDEGLHIKRKTTLGKRAGATVALRMGRVADLNLNLMLGAGHAGAVGIGAGLVIRWDEMVPGARAHLAHDATENAPAAVAAPPGAAPPAPASTGAPHRQAPPARPAPPPPARRAAAPPQQRLAPPGAAPRPLPAPGAAPAAAVRPTPVQPAAAPTERALSPSAPPPPATAARDRKKGERPEDTPPAPAPAKPKPDVNSLPPLQAAPPR
jgi:hypothetical protein